MKENIPKQLYREFYKENNRVADSTQASVHWKNFSKKFKVTFDADENIQAIEGYGFGGSGDNRVSAKLAAALGNRLSLLQLRYPGLSAEVSRSAKLVRSMGLSFSQDAFRQVCTKFLLQKIADKSDVPLKNILIIGDGHGILAALMAKQYPGAKIFLVDLGATLFFQAYYLGKTFPTKQHFLLGNTGEAKGGSGFFYCPAERLEDLPLQEMDLAINIASMQEMTMDVIDTYFKILRDRKTKLFYCCNRLEKTLPDGQVISFMAYPWKDDDTHLLDQPCPWQQFFAGRSAAPNLKLFKVIPIPLLHRFDGIHWHRLTILSH